jgi:type IV pilus assembly protein PilO
MASLPKGQREQLMILVTVLALGGVGAYWWFVYHPKGVELDTKREHIEALDTKNQKAKSEMAKGSLEQLRMQLAEYQQNLVLIRTLVPSGNEVPALLEQVSTAARRAGLDVSAVDPQAVVEGENYDTYRYKMVVLGGYHALGEFFANVGNLTRIILPVNVSLAIPASQNVGKARIGSDAALVEARFELQTFVAKPPPVDQPEPAAKRAGAKR